MRSLVGFGLVSIGLACLLPTPCFAGEEESKTLFAQGRELREQGKCAEAIVFFRKSLETYPEGLGAMRNAAECEEQVGRLASARRTWRDLEVAVTRASQARYEGWEHDAATAQQRLAPRVPKVKIVLVGEGQVLLNGRPLDPRLLGLELEQDLGPLEVVLEDDAAVPYKEKLVLEEGKGYVVNLKSRKPAEGGGKKPSVSVTGEPNDDDGGGPSGMMIGGIISLSLGGAALAGMGAALGIRQSAVSDIEEVCPDYEASEACSVLPSQSSEDLQGNIDRAQSSSIAVSVLAAVGGAAAGTGIILLIVDATNGSDKTAQTMGRFRFGAAPTDGGAYMSFGGAF
ncbi:MAG: tetratricopeptide repeat protein [Polyangiaceae bacterium]|nr:tetratricopeptide repeat protein [Polyangiaceae bacterium]